MRTLFQISGILVIGILVCLSMPGISSGQDIETVEQDSVESDSLKNYRSPRGAMLRSIVFPGWGQWYNKKKFKSALIFCAEAACVYGYHYETGRINDTDDDTLREFYSDERRKYVWWLGGVIIYSMIDAFVDAYLDDFDAQMSISNENNSTAIEFKIEFSPELIFQRSK